MRQRAGRHSRRRRGRAWPKWSGSFGDADTPSPQETLPVCTHRARTAVPGCNWDYAAWHESVPSPPRPPCPRARLAARPGCPMASCRAAGLCPSPRRGGEWRAMSRTPKRRGPAHTCLPPGGERDADPARSGDGPACKDKRMLFMLTHPVGTGTDHIWSIPRCAYHRLGTRRQTRCAPPRPPGSAVPVTDPAREFNLTCWG